MLPEGTIRAEHVWKRFRADPLPLQLRAQLKQIKRFATGRRRQWRWVLRDVGLDIQPGESVGLVGINGSGKSTLLKILTKVMYPYAGRVEVAGRVGALIEVRAGIHPELSGRENIHLYGTLLGLSRRQVSERFDQIVEFAQVETAVDRQVKFYSSGMQMRLGFAVAAFLEPAVLLVDEVLAVGDATFQQRCIDRMRDVLHQGTTLVFVSHDLATVEGICERAAWLHNGVLREDGPVRQVLTSYRQALEQVEEMSPTTGPIQLVKAVIEGPDGTPRTQEPASIRLVLRKGTSTPGRVSIGVSEGPAAPIFLLDHHIDVGQGEVEVRCDIDALPLPRGRFFLWAGVFERGGELLRWHPAAHFDVIGPDLDVGPPGIIRLSPVHVGAKWQVEEL
ncbi:MAG TPA: polysaccharide ABC transporter ATP-binding protein [Acidimicrobiales bacterium]